MAHSLQLHLLLLALIPIQQCGGRLIDLEDIVYKFLLLNCTNNERLVTYDVFGDNKTRGPHPEQDLFKNPPVTIEVGPVTYGKAQVQSLQISAVYVQIFHNNQTDEVDLEPVGRSPSGSNRSVEKWRSASSGPE
ncbi:uncharacterized protein ISCGN_028312 [Ixodes scapularis]